MRGRCDPVLQQNYVQRSVCSVLFFVWVGGAGGCCVAAPALQQNCVQKVGGGAEGGWGCVLLRQRAGVTAGWGEADSGVGRDGLFGSLRRGMRLAPAYVTHPCTAFTSPSRSSLQLQILRLPELLERQLVVAGAEASTHYGRNGQLLAPGMYEAS